MSVLCPSQLTHIIHILHTISQQKHIITQQHHTHKAEHRAACGVHCPRELGGRGNPTWSCPRFALGSPHILHTISQQKHTITQQHHTHKAEHRAACGVHRPRDLGGRGNLTWSCPRFALGSTHITHNFTTKTYNYTTTPHL